MIYHLYFKKELTSIWIKRLAKFHGKWTWSHQDWGNSSLILRMWINITWLAGNLWKTKDLLWRAKRTQHHSNPNNLYGTWGPCHQKTPFWWPGENFWPGQSCLQYSLVCWAISVKGILREMQLCSIVADQQVQDSLVLAGTGSGKTLPIAICTLLDNPAKKKVTIVVSPLKRLQKIQVAAFKQFGIHAVAINEDTPQESTWWLVSVEWVTHY